MEVNKYINQLVWISKLIKVIGEFLLDLIFPIECLGCGEEGQWLCSACLGKIKLKKNQICPCCQRASDRGAFCSSCAFASKLKGIIVAADYDQQLLPRAIHSLKYQGVRGLAKPLANILLASFKQWPGRQENSFKNIILIPVPLHRRRERARGFNQAELLASNLAEELKIKMCSGILYRIRNTSSQTKHDYLRRRKNIKNAFRVERGKLLKDKIVFLVDDVCTTSATLEECAKAIEKAEPKEIWGLVLARGG